MHKICNHAEPLWAVNFRHLVICRYINLISSTAVALLVDGDTVIESPVEAGAAHEFLLHRG